MNTRAPSPSRPKRAGGDKRGSAASRRARKGWMLSPGAGAFLAGVWVFFGGNGVTVPCIHCGCELTFESVEADRIVPGGSYRRANVQPACRACNLSRSDNVEWVGALAVA